MAILYHSTNNHNEKTCFREALLNGMASNYGLYMMPRKYVPKMSKSDIRAMETESYAQIAFRALYPYVTPDIKEKDFKTGITLLVGCGIGRGINLELEKVDNNNWNFLFISAVPFVAFIIEIIMVHLLKFRMRKN